MSDAPVDASSARARATDGNEASTSDDRILNLGESRDFVSELRDFKTASSPVKTRISAHVRSDSTCSTDGCVLRDRGRGNERARATIPPSRLDARGVDGARALDAYGD